MHTHVWAETFKEPPIPGIKTIKKKFFLKKERLVSTQSPNEERIQNEKSILLQKSLQQNPLCN